MGYFRDWKSAGLTPFPIGTDPSLLTANESGISPLYTSSLTTNYDQAAKSSYADVVAAIQEGMLTPVELHQMAQAGWLEALPDFDAQHFQNVLSPWANQRNDELTGNSYGNLAMLGLAGGIAGGMLFGPGSTGISGATEAGTLGAAGDMFGAGAAYEAGAAMPAAIPETAGTLAEWGLAETAPGVFAAPGTAGYVGAPTAPAVGSGGVTGMGGAGALGAGTLGAQAFGGEAAAAGGGGSGGGGSATGGGSGGGSWLAPEDDWWKRLLPGIPGLIGAVAAGSQAEDFEDLAHQYSQMGAPYRSRLEQLYQSPEGFLNSPEVRVPIQQGTDMLARSLSVQGNPAGSGNALQQLQNYASGQLFSRLGQEKDRLGGFGGLTAYNQAAPQAATNVINAQGRMYSDLGGAAADIFNPQRRYTLEDFARMFK